MHDGVWPTTIEEENAYYLFLIAYIEANASRWGLSSTKVTNLRALIGDPASVAPLTWIYWFNLWVDEYHSRTIEVTDELGKKGVLIQSAGTNIFENIPADLWTDLDRESMHRKIGTPRAKPVQHKNAISEEVFFLVTPVSNGGFEVLCRTTHDSSSAGLANGATGVEMAMGITSYEYVKDEESGELTPIPKKLATNVSQCPLRHISTKARFDVTPEGENLGKYMNVYLRWINLTHPELAGKWCGPIAVDFLP